MEMNKQQQAYVELEMLSQQLAELENSLISADDQYMQLSYAKEALENLKEGDEEILVPLTAGILLPVKNVDLDKIKVAVGNDLMVDKNSEEAIATIEKYLATVKENRERTQKIFDEVSLKAIKLQEEIEKNH